MDLTALKNYLAGKGAALTLAVDDANLPPALLDLLDTMPNQQVTLQPGPNGLTLQGATLTVSGSSADTWPLDGVGQVVVTLSSVVFTLHADDPNAPVIECVASASLPLSASLNIPVTITALQQDSAPWQVKLAGPASGATPLQLLLLGKDWDLPFVIPPNLDLLEQALDLDPDNFQITFYPNTTFDAYYTFHLGAPGARWSLIDGVLAFNGIDIYATITTNGLSATLVGHLLIDQIGVDLGVGMNTGDDWTAFVMPTAGVFPGVAALVAWISGSNGTLASDTSQGFANLQFNPKDFDLALTGVTLGFNCRSLSLNYLNIQSLLTVGGMPLDLVLSLPDLSLVGSLHGDQPVNVKDMLTAFGLPTGGVPDNLNISDVNFSARARDSYYSAGITVEDTWQVGPVTLEEISVFVAYAGAAGFSGQFNCSFALGDSTQLYLSTQDAGPGNGWVFSGGTQPDSGIAIGSLLSDFCATFGVVLPNVLQQFDLKNFAFTFDTSTGNASGQFTLDFAVGASAVEMTVTAVLTKNAAAYTVAVTAQLHIGAAEFDVSFSDQPGAAAFTAGWKDAANPLEFGDVATCFGWTSMPALPESLDLALSEAEFSYDLTSGALAFSAHSEHYGQALYVSLPTKPAAGSPNTGQRISIFSLAIPLNLRLSDLPILGNEMPSDTQFAIQELQVIVASAALAATDITALNTLITGTLNDTALPAPSLGAGLSFAATLQIEGATQTLLVPLSAGATSSATPAVTATVPVTPVATSSAPVYPAGAAPMPVAKSFGPLTLQSVSLGLSNGQLCFTFTGSLLLGPLGFELIGFTVTSPISKFDSQISLHGLGLQINKPPLSLNGLFLESSITIPGYADPIPGYNGALTIGYKDYALAAMGSYAKLPGGATSIFFYGFLGAPLGGLPAILYVTGVAAGFGYNRSMTLPVPEDIDSYPLIQPVLSGSAPLNFDVMNLKFLPREGAFWLAVGLRLESFHMVESFVLLTFQFGDDLEIDVLGRSQMQYPSKDTGDPVPLANVLIGLVARIIPERGVLDIQGQFLSGSYIYDPLATITGGFALLSLFKDQVGGQWDGGQEGDFIVTLGGYGPLYTPKPYYPQVPRLEMLWKVNDNLQLRADAYFAITPQAMMVGGQMVGNFEAGGVFSIHVQFTIGADFIIYWKPYHYLGDIHADLKVSARINVDCWLFTIHASVDFDLSADLTIWGPPFSGHASVRVHVLVSFTVGIDFGQAQQTPPPIDWATFKAAFLPAPDKIVSANIGAGLIASQSSPVVDARPATNTTPAVAAQPAINVVNAKELKVILGTPIPAQNLTVNGSLEDFSKVVPPIAITTNFGIKPMAKTSGDMKASTLVVTINEFNEQTNAYQALDPEALKQFVITPITKNMPASLWQPAATSGKIPANDGTDLIANLLTGVSISTPATNPINPIPAPTQAFDPIHMPPSPGWAAFSYSANQFTSAQG